MRNSVHGIARLLIAAGVALAAPLLAARAEAAGLNAVCSTDGIDVWAVGNGGAVLRSLDGGAVWKSAPLGTRNLYGVAAFGANTVVVGDSGECWASQNSGFSWTQSTIAGGANLRGAVASPAGALVVCGAGGNILASTDGGLTWAPASTGTSADLAAIAFTSATEAWACGAGGTLLHSIDGGASWTPSTPFGTTRALDDIATTGANVLVGGDEAFFATSTNSGASWTVHDLDIVSRSDVNGVARLADGRVFLCGGGGYLRASSDGGASWTFPLHSIVSGLSDIHFVGANGWASAELSDNVVRTTDGGATWSVPGGGAFSYLWSKKKGITGVEVRGSTFDVDPFNRDKLYAVMGTAVYASWNRGNNWPQIATITGGGTKTNAFYVSRTDTLTWVACAQDPDRVTRTTDGGLTWTTKIARQFGEYGVPLERDENNPDRLLFGPNDGRLYESTDFGQTWTERSNPGFRSPCDIVVVPNGGGVIYVGDGTTGTGIGQMFRSTDDGLTFSLAYNAVGSEVPMIASTALDSDIGYATNWSSGGVRHTGDRGVNWPQVATTGSAWGVDIAKDDPHVALYGTYDGGPSFATIDDGASFSTALLSNSSNYGVFLYDRATWLVLQSNGIHKATITQPAMPVNNAELLTVIAPNGGETWQYNQVRTISWSSQNVTTVKIESSIDGGPWETIAASASGPAGAYPWIVPATPSANVRIRVSDAGDLSPSDESNAAFSIVVPSIASTRASLSYGAIPVGGVKSDTLRFVNTGTATLVISSITTSAIEAGGSSAFTPKRSSFSISAGASDTLAVVFAPSAEQAYLDTLLVEHNAPASPLAIPLSGSGAIFVAVESSAPDRYELGESAPNPAGAAGATITYALPRDSDVRLVVYNAAGQEVATLASGRQSAGRYAVRFPDPARATGSSGASLASGVYVYHLRAGAFSETRRLVLLR